METKKTVCGDVFIIPNTHGSFKSFPEFIQEGLKKRMEDFGLGIEFKADDVVVQLWITSKEVENWQCHSGLEKVFGTAKEEGETLYFPEYFPARLFSGKKEGDTIELVSEKYNTKIQLTLNQLQYRYKRFGRFEEVLAYVGE